MAYQNARLGKVYVAEEATYADPDTEFASADAFRHNAMALSESLNRQDSGEKKGTPGLARRFSRHIIGGFNLSDAYLQPSGVVGTVPEGHLFFEHGLGEEVISAGDAVVIADPAAWDSETEYTAGQKVTHDDQEWTALQTDTGTEPGTEDPVEVWKLTANQRTTTSAFVDDDTDFEVGHAIVITFAGDPAISHVRILTEVDADTLAWTPPLPSAPAVADTIKGAIVYRPTSDISKSLLIGHYFPDVAFEAPGCVVDSLRFVFSGNDEARFSASGPGQTTEDAQEEPEDFTYPESATPVTGTVGAFLWEGAAMDVLECNVEIRNGLILDNEVLGTDRARGFYRNGRRSVTGGLRVRFTDSTTLKVAAESATPGALFVQVGKTAGKIVAAYCPAFDLDIPDTPDGDGVPDLSYTGAAVETGAGNNEVFLIFG